MARHPIEEWLPTETLVGTPDQVYAYGIIALTYNKLEDAMVELFVSYLPISEEAGQRFAAKLTNNERLSLLLELVEEREEDENVKDRVRHAVKLFNICAENRNILAHGVRDNYVYSEKMFIIRKWASGGKKLTHYDISLTNLRQVALDMRVCLDYVVELLFFLVIHLFVESEDRDGFDTMGQSTSLPGKPPQPSKLIPRPPGADHEAALLLAQSSDPSPQSGNQA
jgi:hypothetical protein